MTPTIKDKYLKAIKEHVCSYCGKTIKYKEIYRRVHKRKGKGVESFYYHCECSNKMEELNGSV